MLEVRGSVRSKNNRKAVRETVSLSVLCPRSTASGLKLNQSMGHLYTVSGVKRIVRSQRLFGRNGIIIVNKWLALSPDLNGIENMWKMVGDGFEGQSLGTKIFYANLSDVNFMQFLT